MDEHETFDALHSFASIARELAGQPGMEQTTQRIVELAVKVIGCDAAVLSHMSGQRLVFEAGTSSELVQSLEAITRKSGQSVSMLACQQRNTVLANDLENDAQWDIAGPRAAAEVDIRSALAFHLQLEDRDLGALTFYSAKTGYFTPGLCDLAGVYADHAAIALSMAREHQQVENLQVALTTNREIGAAVGIVMTRLSLDEAGAFDLLRVTSQHLNKKIHDLAQAIIESGDIESVAAAGVREARRLRPSAQ